MLVYVAVLPEGEREGRTLADVARVLAGGAGAAIIAAPLALWADHTLEPTSVTVAGSLQDELGCPGDWQPDCLRSWLQDPDGDNIYTFSANLPAGDYEASLFAAGTTALIRYYPLYTAKSALLVQSPNPKVPKIWNLWY